ncbi:glutathione synthase [Aliikangiella coralliicola]|uniref:Glutathione synthetase n=1 Tax=Aliikangiella coralliicola TaxID=2592383 RepID=A0A545UHT9_9GAMM|nr:glutathione synthase [Aliikangiella coralliicola]TQV89019.1 glutathione synthase [Aliikangiella coralliicola]
MSLKIAILMDPISQINIKKDSSFAMLLEAQSRGHQLFYLEQHDLILSENQVISHSRSLKVMPDPDQWFELGEQSSVPVTNFDVILMRKDPPFDMEFVYSTYLLQLAREQGVLVVNDPQSIRDANEKLYTAWFPQCSPGVLVSRNETDFREFLSKYGDIILKPLDGMGGSSIFRVRNDDPNIGVIIETLTQLGTQSAMAQEFIPDIVRGDKRILMVDGEPIPYCLARIPAKGETRGNLAAGGRGEAQPLSERDRWIASQVGPTLKEKGLMFVGLDVIGDYLTEINVTSPTCICEIDAAFDTNIAGTLFDAIEKRFE